MLDISWQKLQFLSPVVHQASYLHSELPKYKSNLVTLRFESPMHLPWPHNEVWVLCRACKLSTVQPGLPSQNPLQLLPVHPPSATPDSSEVSKAPGCSTLLCLGIFLFSLCEILYFHAPSPVSWTTLTHPSRHSHSSFFKTCMIFPKQDFSLFFLCSLPTFPFYPQL